VVVFCKHGNEPADAVNGEEFHDQMNFHKLLLKDRFMQVTVAV
jgi:hypothetical protein